MKWLNRATDFIKRQSISFSSSTKQYLQPFLISLLIGVVLGSLTDLVFKRTTFKNEISLAEILNASSTLLVAVLIGLYLNKQYSDFRIEKDLLIGNVKEVDLALKNVHKIFLDNYHQQSVTDTSIRGIKLGFKEFSNNISILESSLNRSPRMTKISIMDLKELRGHYRKILTNDPFPSKAYTIASFNAEDKAYRDLLICIQSLIFDINRR